MADASTMAEDAAAPRFEDGDAPGGRPDAPGGKPRAPGGAPGGPASPGPMRWAQLWQVPTIVISVALIVLGVRLVIVRAPENDFAGALDQVDALIAEDRLEEARAQLREVIEPHLDEATALEQARFHATVADWLHADQAARGVTDPQRCRDIVDLYHRARMQGLAPDAVRLERWAEAAVAIGDLETARHRLAELEALSMAEGAAPVVRQRRNRVLRRLVDHALARGDRAYDETMALLENYRHDDLLGPDDRVWAVARMSELRIADGRFSEAVDHLLLETRRIGADGAPPAGLGELYVLLGRAYMLLGDPIRAEFQARRALEVLDGAHPARGQALLLLGQLAVLDDDLEQALLHFDAVVRDFPATEALPAALLGRAEVRSQLGRHEEALADYAQLAEILPDIRPSPLAVTRDAVARSLVDRHDAAVVTGQVRRALAYGEAAADLYPAGEVPAQVLFRLAATHRQVADDIVAAARPYPGAPLDEVPPEARYEAGRHYLAAAERAVAHLRALVGVPGADEEWSESLWRAADSFDLAGDVERAAAHFAEYVAGRAEDDPRRAVAMERLGAALRALGRHEEAVEDYEQLRRTYPHALEASRAAVPMARSLVALDRRPEAEALLLGVLAGGDDVLEPASLDYRDALVELGTIYYERQAWPRAIERLTEALERYPDAAGAREVVFRLADSYRGQALSLADRLESDGSITPAERGDLERRREADLERAAAIYRRVYAGLPDDEARPLDRPLLDVVRLAHLYEADCAFHLGRYADAVPLYEKVVRRYGNHHASLTALVQIINCYSALGQDDRAAAAQERAMVRLRELPESAFTAPDSLLDRAAWERWLENLPPDRMTAAASPGA